MHHRAYDTERLDLLSYLEPRWRAEVAHAVLHLGLVGASAARPTVGRPSKQSPSEQRRAAAGAVVRRCGVLADAACTQA
jgi:hypothetical protein